MIAVDMVIRGANELITCSGPVGGVGGDRLQDLVPIPNGAVAIADGRIVEVGPTDEICSKFEARQEVDASGCLVSPSLVDPHTHLVHMGARERELDARATQRMGDGISTGGINETIDQTSRASDQELEQRARLALDQMLLHGTGLVEAKTGYGRDMNVELRLLALTRGLNGAHAIEVVPTFLGAHIPPASDRNGFVESVIAAIPKAARLAEYCDVACDPVCFTFEECDRIAEVATAHGMRLRVHANQAGPWRGLELAAKWRAASADHGDFASLSELAELERNGVTLTLLPGANFHMLETTSSLRGEELQAPPKPHLPLIAARILKSGCVPAAATNYNPGSSPCVSMQMVMQLLPRLFRLSFSATWYMSTLNGAAALGRADRTGSLEPGKEANLIIWNVARHGQVIERFGINHVRDVWLRGRRVVTDQNLTI